MRHWKRLVVLMAAAACLASANALAQGYPGAGHNRPGGMGGLGPDRGKQGSPGPPQVTDPMMALERELPSLRVDLKLTPGQGAQWDSFERGVRDVAEMGRARLRHPALPAPENERAASAQGMLFGWAEDDRMKADAMTSLTRKFDALYSQLNNVQRLEVDRRFALSQSEPLGAR